MTKLIMRLVEVIKQNDFVNERIPVIKPLVTVLDQNLLRGVTTRMANIVRLTCPGWAYYPHTTHLREILSRRKGVYLIGFLVCYQFTIVKD